MKKQRGLTWKVGLFAICASVLFLGTLFIIGKQKNLFGSVFQIQAVFSNVGGLKIGNNVRFGGITVGTIDDIQILSDTTMKVVMAIQSNVRRFIKTDATASIGSEGLMGDKVIEISPGTFNRRQISA